MHLAVLLLFCLHIIVTAASCVNFALPTTADPTFELSLSVGNGLTLWDRRDNRNTLNIASADTFNGSLSEAYLSLPGDCYTVGPIDASNTLLVTEALRSAGRTDRTFASLVADDTLTRLRAAGMRAISLMPSMTNVSTFPALQELADEESYVWTLLGSSATSDQHIINATKSYLESDEALFRTVQYVGTFNSSDLTSLDAEVEFISRLRPRPSVLMVSWEALGLGEVTRSAALDTLVDAFSKHELQPKAIWLAQSLSYSALERSVRRRIKFWSANALWSRSLDIGSHKSKFGKADDFADHYRDEFGDWPDDYAAIGAASALVVTTLADQPIAGFKLKPECFWGAIELAENGTNKHAQWRWVQYLSNKEESIEFADQNDASRESLSFPGRWSWRSYSLGSNAIASLVIATVLCVISLAIFIWAGVKAVRSYLYEHDEAEMIKEEEDVKGKKRN